MLTSVSQSMDRAAAEAEKELKFLKGKGILEVAAWWEKWFKTAGHKRLGRLLVMVAREGIPEEFATGDNGGE